MILTHITFKLGRPAHIRWRCCSVWAFAADFGNKTKKVKMRSGEVTTTKLVKTVDFVT